MLDGLCQVDTLGALGRLRHGLRWFCVAVKANVAQQMNGGGIMQDQDQLRDVVAVCDQWLAGFELENSVKIR